MGISDLCAAKFLQLDFITMPRDLCSCFSDIADLTSFSGMLSSSSRGLFSLVLLDRALEQLIPGITEGALNRLQYFGGILPLSSPV